MSCASATRWPPSARPSPWTPHVSARGTPNAKKDVRSPGLLDVETHPHITFASDTLQEMPDGWLVTGIATDHGPTIPVDVRVDRVTHEGAGLRVHGRNEHLDRTALGITGSRGMVGRYLDVEVDAFATPA
ncbi:MAG: YceI family protein [Nocardioidaceae bacterium]